MITDFTSFVLNLLTQLESTFVPTNPRGLLALFSLAVITDIGVPVPFVLDTILLLTAFQVWISPHHNWMPVILIVLMLFVGRQVGSGILYLLARRLGRAFLSRVEKRFPSVGFRLEAFKLRLRHWAPLVVVTGRLTPGLLQITSIASGTMRMRYQYFAAGIAMASLIYDGILVFLAFIAAHNPGADNADFTIWLLIALVITVGILWPLIFFLVQRSKNRPPDLENKT
jgi:membrane protein DedA with SNARE-associated domain